MNAMSSTSKAGLSWGFVASLVMGIVAIAWPEIYDRVPPGFEGALAVGIGTVMAYRQPEKVLRAKWEAEK